MSWVKQEAVKSLTQKKYIAQYKKKKKKLSTQFKGVTLTFAISAIILSNIW